MAVTVYTKDDVDILLGEQATFGTVLADIADFNGTTPEWGEIVDCEIGVLDTDVKTREPNRSNSGNRILLAQNVQHDEKGTMPKFTIQGDAKKHTLAGLLYGVVQNVSEAVGTPFEKTFTFASTQPDFTANAGWFGTLIVKQPSSLSQKVRDMIVRKLTLSCEPENNQGRMQMTAELIGRGAVTRDSAPNTGVLARYAQSFFYFHDLKVASFVGNTIYPLSIPKIEITNNALAIGQKSATSGDFLTYALGAPSYSVTFTIRVLWDTVSAGLKNTEATTPASQAGALILSWGTDNTDGYLNFTTYCKVDAPSPDAYGPTKAVDFNFTMVDDEVNEPFTCVIADALDRAW